MIHIIVGRLAESACWY